MFLDAVYKNLQGFFDFALLNCQTSILPRWPFVTSSWQIVAVCLAYMVTFGWTLPRRRRNRRRGPFGMDPGKFKQFYTAFYTIAIAWNVYLNFNTMVMINKTSKAGAKLLIVGSDGKICSCFIVMWSSILLQIFQVYGEGMMSEFQNENVSCVQVLYNTLRIVNAWITFQFYQRESATIMNIIALADGIGYAFAWAWRCGNTLARSISATPEVRNLTACQSVLNSFIAGAFLIITADIDQRFLWWTLEYNMMALFLIGLLCGWGEFRQCLMYIIVALFEFSAVGIYAVYNRDMDLVDCNNKCIRKVVAGRAVGQGGNQAEVVGPVQGCMS